MERLVTSVELIGNRSRKAAHYHDCHQLIYVSRGCAEVIVSGKGYRAQPGTLVLISRFEQHSLETDGECERYVAAIAAAGGSGVPEEEALLLSALINRPGSFRHAVELPDAEEAGRLLRRMLGESEEGEKALGGYVSGLLLLELLAMVYRCAPEIFALQRRENAEAVRRIQSRFERDFAASYSVAELAAEQHMSASHLAHVFKSAAGVSMMEYLKACRLAAAKKYLAQTSLAVGEIVEKCGFSDSSNFSRTFRAQTGMSPSEFRKSYGRQSAEESKRKR